MDNLYILNYAAPLEFLEDVLSYLPEDMQKTLNPNGYKDKVNLALAKGKRFGSQYGEPVASYAESQS